MECWEDENGSSLTTDLLLISFKFALSSVLALISSVICQGYWLQVNELGYSLAAISDLFRFDIQGNAKTEFLYLKIFQMFSKYSMP